MCFGLINMDWIKQPVWAFQLGRQVSDSVYKGIRALLSMWFRPCPPPPPSLPPSSAPPFLPFFFPLSLPVFALRVFYEKKGVPFFSLGDSWPDALV